MSSPLHVHLEQYEGPLDLLLDLIRKHQVDIHDIPIAQITSQYLDYVQKAMELDMELGAEFVHGRPGATLDLLEEFGGLLIETEGDAWAGANGEFAAAEVDAYFPVEPVTGPSLGGTWRED